MPKKIIVLEKISNGFNTYRYLLWAEVPSSRQFFYENNSANSLWKNASQDEISMIRSGSISELSDIVTLPPGTNLTTAQNALVERWNYFQNDVSTSNPWLRYGSYYEGTSWTLGGVS